MEKRNWLVSGVLGLMAAVVYFASLANYTFPGESAQLIAAWRGLELLDAPKYPLMAVFAKLFGGGNLIAPICGAIAVMCVYYLVASFVAWRVRGEYYQTQRGQLSLIAGLSAAAVFMFSPAVRSAATHLEPRMFDFTWALVTFVVAAPFLRGMKGGNWLLPIVLGVAVAFGLCDSALFLALLPFYLAVVVMAAYGGGRKPYASLFLFVLFLIATFFVAVGFFGLTLADHMKSLASELRVYRTVPGWLFVTIFATLPFVTAIFSSDKAFKERAELVQWLFHSAMTFVAVLAVATPLSPSALMEPYGITPVATSAFAAAVTGYLVAFWWLNRKTAIGIVAGGAFAFVLAVTVVWNLFVFDGDIGAFADKVAGKIVDDLGDRRWFISDGVLDSHLKIVAAERGKDLIIVSLARDLDESYRDELVEIVKRDGIGGSKNGALQLSLSLGVLPFVQDWFASDPSAVKDAAVFGAPDLWYSTGLSPVPEFLFFGADEARVPDWTAWKEFDVILKAPKGWGSYHDRKVSNPVDRLRFSLRRHLGFVANNRGVYLQDQKKDDDAFKMYELVLNEIDHDNICAIFNEVAMVGQKHSAAMSKQRELERMLKTAVEDKNRRYLLWRLSTYYGYIRNPDMFVRLGHVWARTGRPGEALRQIRRAIDFVPTDKRAVLLNMMAALYASEHDQRSSRRLYEEVLRKNAKDHDALVGLMRLELLDGNSAKALEYMQRAAEISDDDNRKNIELAMVAMMKSDLGAAKSLITKVTDAEPKNLQAWSLLAAVTMQQVDAAKTENDKIALTKELKDVIVPAMERQTRDPHDYYLQSTKGFILLREGAAKRKEARDAFAAAAKSRPDVGSAQDILLGLDISLDDKANAETHARDMLRRNRNAPMANYVMGSIALGRGKYSEAEAFLRKAAEAQRPAPLAFNDLAEVLRRTGRLAEAESYARKGTERTPDLYVVWETLGSILIDANHNLDEAEAAIRRACELSRDKDGREADIRMLVSLARIQLKNNDKQHAKVTIRKVQSRIGELSDFERKEFEEVQKLAK